MFTRAVNDIFWSKESYSTSFLRDHYAAPRLVKVTQGHCGAEDKDSLSQGQVIRIHRWLTQQRVIAVDSRGRHLSIPLDFDLKFEVLPERKRSLSKRKNVVMRLADVIRQYNLPKKVRFSSVHLTPSQALEGDCLGVRMTMEPLELLGTHEEVYLNGNAVNFGDLDPSTLSIPVHHDIEMSLALGLRSGKKKWQRLMNDLDNEVATRVRFDSVQGNNKITIHRPTSEIQDASVGTSSTETFAGRRRHQSLTQSYGTLRERATDSDTRRRTYSVADNIDSFSRLARPTPGAQSAARMYLKRGEARRPRGADTASVSGTSTSATSPSESTADDASSWAASEDYPTGYDDDTGDVADDIPLPARRLFNSTSRLFRPDSWAEPTHPQTRRPDRRRRDAGPNTGRRLTSPSSVSMDDINRILKDNRHQPSHHQRGNPDGRSVNSGQETEADPEDVDESTDL